MSIELCMDYPGTELSLRSSPMDVHVFPVMHCCQCNLLDAILLELGDKLCILQGAEALTLLLQSVAAVHKAKPAGFSVPDEAELY